MLIYVLASNLLVMSYMPEMFHNVVSSGSDRALLRCVNKQRCIPSGPQAFVGSRAFVFFAFFYRSCRPGSEVQRYQVHLV